MRYLMLTLFIMINSISASIAFAEDAKTALAIEYLKLLKTSEMFEATIDIAANQVSSINPELDKDQFKTFLESYMGWEILREQTIEIIINSLTEEELKAVNGFYKSKHGVTYANKSPAISAAISELIGANYRNAMTKMQQK